GDLLAWCLLAGIVGVTTAQVGSGLRVLAGTAAYLALMLVVVRPLLTRLVQRWDLAEKELPRGRAGMIFVAVLLSALATEAIGIHALFGAFLLGVLVPHDSRLAQDLNRQLHTVVTVLLLPAFFAYTGMRTRIDLVDGAAQWALCLLIVVIATAGKFGGTLAAARLVGLGWRPAAALGALMNTRGLMELIVLNIGLELGVISPALFAMLVIMALVTTGITAPLLRWILPEATLREPGLAAAARPKT
ncbi:MAG TPA: cation:proton antiporter, partial [Solimonas sp.]|nr:cation:proton antiporter [Solimonas sp.]